VLADSTRRQRSTPRRLRDLELPAVPARRRGVAVDRRLSNGREPTSRRSARSWPKRIRQMRMPGAVALIASGRGESHLSQLGATCVDTRPPAKNTLSERRPDSWTTGSSRRSCAFPRPRPGVNEMDEFMSVRPEGHFGHYQMMVHALAGRPVRRRGRCTPVENTSAPDRSHLVRPTRRWLDGYQP